MVNLNLNYILSSHSSNLRNIFDNNLILRGFCSWFQKIDHLIRIKLTALNYLMHLSRVWRCDVWTEIDKCLTVKSEIGNSRSKRTFSLWDIYEIYLLYIRRDARLILIYRIRRCLVPPCNLEESRSLKKFSTKNFLEKNMS